MTSGCPSSFDRCAIECHVREGHQRCELREHFRMHAIPISPHDDVRHTIAAQRVGGLVRTCFAEVKNRSISRARCALPAAYCPLPTQGRRADPRPLSSAMARSADCEESRSSPRPASSGSRRCSTRFASERREPDAGCRSTCAQDNGWMKGLTRSALSRSQPRRPSDGIVQMPTSQRRRRSTRRTVPFDRTAAYRCTGLLPGQTESPHRQRRSRRGSPRRSVGRGWSPIARQMCGAPNQACPARPRETPPSPPAGKADAETRRSDHGFGETRERPREIQLDEHALGTPP